MIKINGIELYCQNCSHTFLVSAVTFDPYRPKLVKCKHCGDRSVPIMEQRESRTDPNTTTAPR